MHTKHVMYMFLQRLANYGRSVRTLTGHSGDVLSVCFSPDGTMVCSGSSDKTLKLWSLSSSSLLETFTGHSDSVCSVCFSPDGTMVCSGSDDKTLKLW